MFKKILKILAWIIGAILAVSLIFIIIIWVQSPGKTDPITDENGNIPEKSIAKIESIQIGGIDQYLITRGADSTKPVILFLHGGPGSPEIAFMRAGNEAIENDFVMVYWEQRGAGKTYSKDTPLESLNVEQFISDTKELSEYLIKRYRKEKIFILGHSWGSYLGILTAFHHPELYHAYMGTGQVGHQYIGEQISFEWTKEQAKKLNDAEGIEALNTIRFPEIDADIEDWLIFLGTERRYVMKYGGGPVKEIRSFVPLLKLILGTDEYTLSEKLSAFKSSMISIEELWTEFIHVDLKEEIDSMRVPVFILQGKEDYQTPYDVAKEFFDQLKAPDKEFYTFENSSHSPPMEEVEKFNSIVKEIVSKYE